MSNISTNYSDYSLKNSQLNSTAAETSTEKEIEVFGNDNPVQQEQSSTSLRQEFESVQQEQGFFGKLWDGIKSFTGIGLSSGKVENAITQYENGEISYDEAMQTVQSYQQKQDDGVNIITNVATGLATTCLTFGTGGLGLLFGGLIGGVAKAGLKTIDRATNEVSGDELNGKEIIKDVITGGVDGTLNVLTGGMAGKAGSTLGKSILCGTIQGAKAGAISSGAAGATEYITDSILDEDKEFNFGELMSYTATNAISGGIFGGVMGGITTGIEYGKTVSKGTNADKILNTENKNFTDETQENIDSLYKLCDFDNDAEVIQQVGKPVKIGNKNYNIKTINKDGKIYIAAADLRFTNGNTCKIRPVTFLQNETVGINKLILPNGIVSDIVLDPDYVMNLRMAYGRELTNLDILNSSPLQTQIKNMLTSDAKKTLANLSSTNPGNYELIDSILDKTTLLTKTKNGISEEYINNFITKLSECDSVLLKNMADNEIPIKIYDDLALNTNCSHAQYRRDLVPIIKDEKIELDKFNLKKSKFAESKGEIIFSERCNNGEITINKVRQDTFESLPHEMGHALDYNYGSKLNLEKQDFISTINGENYSRYTDLISFSKDFDNAITQDIINMFDIDEKAGRTVGETFNSLLTDKDFQYYLGVNAKSKNPLEFNDIKARKELFAQMVSYITSGKVTNKNFQARIEELFPNCIEFTKKILDK